MKRYHEFTLKDVLYHTHELSGTSIEKGQGVIIGVMAGILAEIGEWDDSIEIMITRLPNNFRLACIPEPWQSEIVEYCNKIHKEYVK